MWQRHLDIFFIVTLLTFQFEDFGVTLATKRLATTLPIQTQNLDVTFVRSGSSLKQNRKIVIFCSL
jgi:hypothetical protein